MNFDEQVKEFDNLLPLHKIRAMAVYKEHGEQQKKLEKIYEDFCGSKGRIIDIHVIGEYQLVHYEVKISNLKRETFDVYLNYKRTGYCASTLDQAILTAIAYKYDGCNSQAAYFMGKMLGIGGG